VLVVDDHSSDGTAAIAEAAAATLLTSAPLPLGWTGQNWALHQASQVSSGDLLVFLDADTQPRGSTFWPGFMGPSVCSVDWCPCNRSTAPTGPLNSSRCCSTWWP
jgi:glycosyltransferase involved in cell wall biosynthesis